MRRLIRRLPVIFSLVLISGFAMWAGATKTPFSGALVKFNGTTQCANETLPPGEYQDVHVPTGDTCTINQDNIIDNNVNVDKDANLIDHGSNVKHDIDAEYYSQVTITGSSGYASGNALVGNELSIDGANLINVTNVVVGVDVEITKVTGSTSNYLRNSCVGGDLEVGGNMNSLGSFDVSGNNGVQCGRSVGVGNTLHMGNNKDQITVSNNTIGNELQVSGSETSGAVVTNNHAAHRADCDDNEPFNGSGNTAGAGFENSCNGTNGDTDGED